MLIFGLASVRAFSSDKPSIHGNTRVRGETTETQSLIGIRFRGYIRFQPREDVLTFLEPQFTKTHGDPSGTSGSLIDPNLSMHQAFLQYSPEAFLIVAGRKELAYGDHLVVGNVGWSNVGRSFDVVSGSWKWNKSSQLDLFASRIESAHHFSGVYLTIINDNDKFLGPVDELDLYLFYSVNRPELSKNQLYTFGIRSKSIFDWLSYRVEATGQATLPGYQIDLELGYRVSPIVNTSIEYFRAHRDYVQLYPTGHKWLGIVDLFSRRNIQGIRLGTNLKIENFNAKIDYHYFMRTDVDSPVYNFSAASYGSTGSAKHVGQEVDVVLGTHINPHLFLSLGGGVFFPSAYFEQNSKSNNLYLAYLEVESRF